MKSSAINRIQIEVAPKRLIYTRSFCAKSKDNTNWNTYTTNEYIHTYIDFLYLYRYMCIYTLSKRRQAAVQNLGRSKCSTFSTHAHTNIFIHIYTYTSIVIPMYFRLFSLLFSAIFSCTLLCGWLTLRMRNFQLPDWWKVAKTNQNRFN